MLAAGGNKPQKTAAGVLILVIFVEVDGKFLDSARQKCNLDLRRACVCVVEASLGRFALFLSLRKH